MVSSKVIKSLVISTLFMFHLMAPVSSKPFADCGDDDDYEDEEVRYLLKPEVGDSNASVLQFGSGSILMNI